MEHIVLSDVFWDSNCYTVTIGHSPTVGSINSELEFSEKPSRPSKSLIDIKLYKKLVDIKEKIPMCTNWDTWVKLANLYEKIQNLSKRRHTSDYYKYREILVYYGLINTKEDNSIHFGENSCGVVKAFIDTMPDINWYIEKTEDFTATPKNRVKNIKVSDSDMEFYHSEDNLGNSRFLGSDDIFNIDTMNVITCDITTECDHDPINKEQLSFKTLFKYMCNSLKLQQIDGFTVYKIYDTVTRPTCQLIYYLTNFYDVEIIKPRSSRITNSEKFIVARNFRGIDYKEIKKLDSILNSWVDDVYCRTMGINIPENIESIFMNYNHAIIDKQCEYMDKIFKLSYNDDESAERTLSAFQNKKAIDFCRNFDIKIDLVENYSCKHFKKVKFEVQGLKNCMICTSCYQLII